MSGRHHDADPRARSANDPRMGSTAIEELPAGPDDGAHDTGPRLRKIECATSRARGPGGPHDRGGGDGEGAAGRDELDSGKGRVFMTAIQAPPVVLGLGQNGICMSTDEFDAVTEYD